MKEFSCSTCENLADPRCSKQNISCSTNQHFMMCPKKGCFLVRLFQRFFSSTACNAHAVTQSCCTHGMIPWVHPRHHGQSRNLPTRHPAGGGVVEPIAASPLLTQSLLQPQMPPAQSRGPVTLLGTHNAKWLFQKVQDFIFYDGFA